TWPGFVTAAHRSRSLSLELADQAADGLRFVRHRPRHRHRPIADQHRNKEIFLVRIDPNVRSNLFHDRLLSYAALTPRGTNPRSAVAQTTCRVRQHPRLYDSGPVIPYCLSGMISVDYFSRF